MFTSPILFFIGLVVILFLAKKIYRSPKWGVFLLIFLLPFERIPSWDMPLEWGITVRLSQVVGLILLARLAVDFFTNLKVREKVVKTIKKPQFVLIVLFLLVSLLSFLWSYDPAKSLMVTGFTLFTVLVGFIIYYYFNSKADFKKLEKVLFYSILAITIFGIYQFFADSFDLSKFFIGLMPRYQKWVLGFPRVQSTALEPLYLINYLLMPLGLFGALYLTGRSQLGSKKLIALIGLMIVNIVLAVSRGGYVAAGMVIIFLVIVLAKNYRFKRLSKYLAIAIGFILISLSFIYLSSYISYQDDSGARKLIQHSSQVESEAGDMLNSREGTWVWAYKAFRENPLLGVGAGGFGGWMIEQGFGGRQRVVNNEILELLTEVGVVGTLPILLFIGLIIGRFVKAFKKTDDKYLLAILSGLFVAFIATLAQYMTFSTLYITHFWALIGLVLASQKIVLNKKTNGNR